MCWNVYCNSYQGITEIVIIEIKKYILSSFIEADEKDKPDNWAEENILSSKDKYQHGKTMLNLS